MICGRHLPAVRSPAGLRNCWRNSVSGGLRTGISRGRSRFSLCSNVAYILGTIAENEVGAQRLVTVAQTQLLESDNLLGNLNSMLKWTDAEAVTNAAGTLGTMAETCEGRQWLLNDSHLEEIVSNVTALLDSVNDWTASNAALVLARIAVCESGCRKLLEPANSRHMLGKLIASLGVDKTGCGMSAAFALGRLCNLDIGRKQILDMEEAPNMITALEKMMANGDTGGSKNACFALSCLATDKDGHAHILMNPIFPEILNTLCVLLESKEQESAWFAAMTLKVFGSHPKGVVKLREHPKISALLKTVACSPTAGEDLLEEVYFTLRKLQPLSQPPPPCVHVPNINSIRITWNKLVLDSGLEVTYSLLDGDKPLYKGPDCCYVLTDVKLCKEYSFTLHVSTEGDDGPYSDVTTVTVEESVPSCPLDFRVIGCTPTQLKLAWAPPAEPNGVIKCYTVYRGHTVIESTSDCSCIISGLAPSKSYGFHVCACTSKGKGAKSSLSASTADPGDHAPGKLTLNVLGRNEMFITWDMPEVPLGRLFNFELCMNGKVVYLGPDRSFTARRLTANTEYGCTVSAITSKGKCESKPVTKKTAKDEYENTTRCLYSPARMSQSIASPSNKEVSELADRLRRSRTQLGIHKEQTPGKTPKAQPTLSKGNVKGTHKHCDSDVMSKTVTRHKQRP
uniref:phosphatidylinositol phosphatase PTPRQ n=1 Tax=Pristiophorus japonicus TaxID=55135 RepID=UPI00398ECDED